MLNENAKVLVVDDSISGRILACTLVKKYFRISEDNIARAEDGFKALTALNEETYDLMITDMQMPGMDGDQLIAAVRGSKHSNIAIILTSASVLKPHEIAGADAICMKPLSSESLKVAIKTAIDRKANKLVTVNGTSPENAPTATP